MKTNDDSHRVPARRLLRVGVVMLAMSCVWPSGAAERPNILWISCEDISPHLGCYGDPNATTPNLDRLASQGARYTHAFTCHGVCAPSRTGIITGMYPIGLGANHMRSRVVLPKHVKCFPYYLRQAGYYCTNNSKTDYNFAWQRDEVWNETSGKAHWKNRPSPEQPFFAVFNLTMSHESRIWPENWKRVVSQVPADALHDPKAIEVPALYPDTDAVRRAHARLLDIIMVMDRRVGRYLDELKAAGQAENTIVLFWSDHGNGLPRAKRWVYDSGTRVPLIVRIPERFRRAGQGDPGSVEQRLVNLIDLGPTVLNLAGVTVPAHMQGRAFLGDKLPAAHEYIFGARDRIDERFDMVRSVRDRRYRYVRNLNNWRPALQHIDYAERSVVRQAMRRQFVTGELPGSVARFLESRRAQEELYDLEKDPWELSNLADKPAHAEAVGRLRRACDDWQIRVRDAHLIPESMLDTEEQEFGNRWAILHREGGLRRIGRLLAVAREAQMWTDAERSFLRDALTSDDAAVRWWAVTGLANAKDDLPLDSFQVAANDVSPTVRIAAARGLFRAGRAVNSLEVLIPELQNKSGFVRHAAMIELDEMGSSAAAARDAVQAMRREKYFGKVVEHFLSSVGG